MTAAAQKDDPEPVAESRPFPIPLLAFLVFMLFWADMYVVQHGADLMGKSGSFPPLVYDPYRTYGDVENANPKSDADLLMAKGKRLFETACAPCHQSTGLGNPGQNIPPLQGSEWVLTPGSGRMIRIVLNSVKGPITVKGATYDNPGMPPWRDSYSDEDIAAIITYTRGNKDWGHNASTVKPEQVKAVREATASRTEQWTAAELLLVPETE
jgi:mono/diheme cytochrome c family protein